MMFVDYDVFECDADGFCRSFVKLLRLLLMTFVALVGVSLVKFFFESNQNTQYSIEPIK